MNYYLIDTLYAETDNICILKEAPEPKEAGFLKSQIMIGNPVAAEFPEKAAFHMTGNVNRMALGSLVPNTMSMLIVNQKIKDLILAHDQAKNLMECLPVSIINHKNRVVSSEHFIINPLQPEDCLDTKHSKIVRNKRGAVIEVEKFVLNRAKIPAKRAVFRPIEDRYVYIAREDWLEQLDSLDLKNPNVYGTKLDVVG
jgi:hypothetical protein